MKTKKNFNLGSFISANSVPILFVIICAIMIPLSGLPANYLLNEVVTRLGRNTFLILSLLIPIMAGMGLNFGMTLGAMAGEMALIMPDSHQINNPVKRAVSSTPAVDKTMPGVNMGFISVNLVSMPPENRMMLSATMPMNCASLALWNCNPNPSLPNSIPTTRKSNNAGTPKR